VAIRTLEEEPKVEIVEELKAMARRRESLDEMIGYVQDRLGFTSDFVVPVMSYFCRAFSLPLRDILPLRELVQLHDDASIAKLLIRIREVDNGVA